METIHSYIFETQWASMSEYKSLDLFSLAIAYHESGYTRNYISYKLIYLKNHSFLLLSSEQTKQ